MVPPARASSRSPALTPHSDNVIAAIDVGTNAVRLEIARVLPDGALETLHQEYGRHAVGLHRHR